MNRPAGVSLMSESGPIKGGIHGGSGGSGGDERGAELGIWGRGIMMGFLSSYGILGILGNWGPRVGLRFLRRLGA